MIEPGALSKNDSVVSAGASSYGADGGYPAADLVDRMNSFPLGEGDPMLPWIPTARETALSLDWVAMLVYVTAATFLVAFTELTTNRGRRAQMRRYLLARHMIVRAPFYRVFTPP